MKQLLGRTIKAVDEQTIGGPDLVISTIHISFEGTDAVLALSPRSVENFADVKAVLLVGGEVKELNPR